MCQENGSCTQLEYDGNGSFACWRQELIAKHHVCGHERKEQTQAARGTGKRCFPEDSVLVKYWVSCTNHRTAKVKDPQEQRALGTDEGLCWEQPHWGNTAQGPSRWGQQNSFPLGGRSQLWQALAQQQDFSKRNLHKICWDFPQTSLVFSS